MWEPGSMSIGPADPEAIRNLAGSHGLDIDPESISVTELGLDFRVAFGSTPDGERWVLRIPRRPDVAERAAVEGRLLQAVAPKLNVSVPDWRVHSSELIAYPLLPGKPGLSLDAGEPVWHFDAESEWYTRSFADVLASLHAVDPRELETTGVEVRTPAEAREKVRNDIARVTTEFDVAEMSQARWAAWLADDSYWPEWSTLTHGEIYPAHLLLEHEQIVGLIDWTTAAIDDPAKDFMFHQATVSPAAFDATVQRYVARGGRVWPKLAEHCAELFSTAPVNYGVYALLTEDPEHLAAAAAQLNLGASDGESVTRS